MYNNPAYYARHLSVTQAVILLVLGVVIAYQPLLASATWIFVISYTVYGFLKNEIKWLWYGVAASPGLELMSRMSRAPFIPHEIGKYYLLLVILLLLFQHIKRHTERPIYKVGLPMVLLMVPSLALSTLHFDYENWVLNVLGIIELAILLFFTARERWSIDQMCRTLQFALMPIIIILAYLTIKTPQFDKINFSLSSNFKTSGDFGSNQVSTILGFGIVLTVLLIVVKRPLFRIAILNYFLIFVLLFRGFLTFSRGGMLVAIIAVIILMLPFVTSSVGRFVKFTFLLLLLGVFAGYTFNKVNEMTGNQLMLRYMGETAGTLSGTKEKNLNTLTSYRLEIAQTDMEMFKDNWLWGVGVGESKDLRVQYGFHPIVSHTEYTRLLSEQGVGGLFVCIVLIIFPFWWVRKQKKYYWKAVCAALFAVALLTCLHSAMRTNTTVVCYLLAAMPIFYKRFSVRY